MISNKHLTYYNFFGGICLQSLVLLVLSYVFHACLLNTIQLFQVVMSRCLLIISITVLLLLMFFATDSTSALVCDGGSAHIAVIKT